MYWKYIFEVKLTFEMLIVRGQQHSLSTHERMFLWRCKSFWDRPGGIEPQPADSCQMLCPFELSGPDICCPMFLNTGSGGIDIFLDKVNIWNVNCARAATFIFNTWMDGLVKVSRFLRQKKSWPELMFMYWKYSTIQGFCTSFALCCALIWFSCDWFYPYPSGLLHWQWGNHMIAPVPVRWPWKYGWN